MARSVNADLHQKVNNLFETDFVRCFLPYYFADINQIPKYF